MDQVWELFELNGYIESENYIEIWNLKRIWMKWKINTAVYSGKSDLPSSSRIWQSQFLNSVLLSNTKIQMFPNIYRVF